MAADYSSGQVCVNDAASLCNSSLPSQILPPGANIRHFCNGLAENSQEMNPWAFAWQVSCFLKVTAARGIVSAGAKRPRDSRHEQ
jgi:hypothetical protein